jgi:3-oxo-5alpha-steroid 4-dehydrogenase
VLFRSADPACLRASVEAYNAAARSGGGDPLGKSADMCQALDMGPFHALDLSIGTSMLPLATITMGGLRVDEADGRVLDNDGRAIPALYAAGRTAVGIPSSRYMSGLSLADCVFSGRRAGASAATATGE